MAVGLVRAVGLEPTFPGWKPGDLPLIYARNRKDAIDV
jgi:hypothetical protein